MNYKLLMCTKTRQTETGNVSEIGVLRGRDKLEDWD